MPSVKQVVANEWRDVQKNLTATRYPIDQAVLAVGRLIFRVVVILAIILAVFIVFNQVNVFNDVERPHEIELVAIERTQVILYAHRATRIALDRAAVSANRK